MIDRVIGASFVLKRGLLVRRSFRMGAADQRNHMIRGLEISAPPTSLWKGEGPEIELITSG